MYFTDLPSDNSSLLSKEESSAIKGLLVILILLGHNSIIMSSSFLGSSPIKNYLYCFHVYCFFVLPWLYGYKYQWGGQRLRNIWFDVRKNTKRLLIPYFFFIIVLMLYGLIVEHRTFDIVGVAEAIITGNERLLGHFIGAGFIWFLPSYFALSFLKSVWYNSNKAIRQIILLLSAVGWILIIFILSWRYELFNYSVLALTQGLVFIAFPLIVNFFIQRSTAYHKYIVFALFIIISATFFLPYKLPIVNKQELYILALTPLAFLCCYHLRHSLALSRTLRLIGKYSLEIYLLQMFVYNIVNAILLRFFNQSIIMGLVSFAVTFSICLVLGIMFNRIPYLRTIMFGK